MERHQHQEQITRPPMSARSQPLQTEPLQTKPLQTVPVARLLQMRPLLILGGVWLAVVMVALVAMNGLLNPDLSKNNPASGAAIAARRAEAAQTARHQSGIPLWLFGAIALSCTAGSVLIAQTAKPPSRRGDRSKPKRLKAYPAPGAPILPVARPQLQTIPQPSFVLKSQLGDRGGGESALPAASFSLSSSGSQSGDRRVPEVPVTAVSVEETHPVDWGEASLADTFDLRKQRSMS